MRAKNFLVNKFHTQVFSKRELANISPKPRTNGTSKSYLNRCGLFYMFISDDNVCFWCLYICVSFYWLSRCMIITYLWRKFNSSRVFHSSWYDPLIQCSGMTLYFRKKRVSVLTENLCMEFIHQKVFRSHFFLRKYFWIISKAKVVPWPVDTENEQKLYQRTNIHRDILKKRKGVHLILRHSLVSCKQLSCTSLMKDIKDDVPVERYLIRIGNHRRWCINQQSSQSSRL